MNKMVLNYEQLRLWSKCYNLVTEKFKDKVDRGGKPYIEHLEHVAYKFPLFEYMLAGLLHDIWRTLMFVQMNYVPWVSQKKS